MSISITIWVSVKDAENWYIENWTDYFSHVDESIAIDIVWETIDKFNATRRPHEIERTAISFVLEEVRIK